MSSATITVNQGKLSGKESKSVLTGKPFYSFQGIPYAKPPVGELRFQAPQPAEKWPGVFDATKEGNLCVQKDMIVTQSIIGSEDCLYLNVHTPELPSGGTPAKAVMVYIHGGSFATGSGTEGLYSPDYIIGHDVIVVTINYRLHILGFLSLDIPECPGNAGLKDMVLALQWVKDNIKFFGGDPNNITIFGESAGSAGVHYLIISPLSQHKGLFHKAILQSGSSLNPWAFTTTPVESAFELGKLLGFDGTDKKELLQFLRSLPDSELADEVFNYENELRKKYPTKCATFVFVPCIESLKKDSFLPEYPWQLMEKANPIPLISGINDQEGLVAYQTDKPEMQLNAFEEYPELFVKCNYDLKENETKKMTDEILTFYLGEKPYAGKVQNLTDLYSDYVIVKDFYEAIKFALDVENCPVYHYMFTYESHRNFYKKIISEGVDIKGACHADELAFLFFAKIFPALEYTEDDLYIIRTITSLWTNFAKTGNPNGPDVNINWSPATNEKPAYLVINKDLTIKEGKMFEERISFWKNLENHYHLRQQYK